MSQQHPIIAVTGSSGAGTSTVRQTFEYIFRREKIDAVIVEGDSFHRYTRQEIGMAIVKAEKNGQRGISHFGPEANLLAELESLFREYAATGGGKIRRYLHDAEEALSYNQLTGTFTPWQTVPEGSDILCYEGLHGAVKTSEIDVAQYPDLLIGVVPIINLEWIQKIHRDTEARGYSAEAVTQTILRRMPDYVNYITPQFSRTHINFQRVPTVDTSNPFVARDVPSQDESFVVIRFANPRGTDFPYLLRMIHDSFMSRANTLVVPGGKFGLAMQLILTPLIWELMKKKSAH